MNPLEPHPHTASPKSRPARAARWAALALLAAGAAQADTYIVTGLGDGSGSCVDQGAHIHHCTTLRAAMVATNATAISDLIVLPSTGTITLTQGQLEVTANSALTITGGATISGGNASRVLMIKPGATVRLERLTIADGRVPDDGAGIAIDGSTNVTLDRVTVRNNVANLSGGGIYNGGTLTVLRSTLSNNTATSYSGGGIASRWEELTLMHSTLSGNTAGQKGGGLDSRAMATTIAFSTLVGNSAPDGGGIHASQSAGDNNVATINYSVIANNSGGDCVTINGSTINAGWSWFGDNADCVTDDPWSSWTIGIGDPKLGPLTDNGGPTKTHLPQRDSPLIDHIWIFEAENDQRGVPRPQGPGVDVGAVEVEVPLFEDGFEEP